MSPVFLWNGSPGQMRHVGAEEEEKRLLTVGTDEVDGAIGKHVGVAGIEAKTLYLPAVNQERDLPDVFELFAGGNVAVAFGVIETKAFRVIPVAVPKVPLADQPRRVADALEHGSDRRRSCGKSVRGVDRIAIGNVVGDA